MSNQNVQEILSFTEDMMLAVIEQRWDALSDMLSQQDRMLRNLFSEQQQPFSETENKHLLTVHRLYQEILVAAKNHRSEIAHELKKIRQGKTQITSYQSM